MAAAIGTLGRPLCYSASSHCFRTEAGAGGEAAKGLYRVHQFGKVEMFAFTLPEQNEAIHEEIVAIEESIYQELGIPYRVVRTCAGDVGAPAYKKYDIEAWMPGKGDHGEYGEVPSASNCTDFQARRLNIRFHDSAGKRRGFVHTLNGTGIAISRTLLAILENYQHPDGSVTIPRTLQPAGWERITQADIAHLSFDYGQPSSVLAAYPLRITRGNHDIYKTSRVSTTCTSSRPRGVQNSDANT